MQTTNRPITALLHSWSQGDSKALAELVPMVYQDLRRISERLLAKERPEHTLAPTALVHEAYLRLLGLEQVSWQDRTPFFAFAARLMRQILVEHARRRLAEKRGGDWERVDLELDGLPDTRTGVDVLDLERVLETLESADPAMVRLIELRFFAGMSEREAAAVLGVSRSTVQREWRVAKRLLVRELGLSS